jgi:hypothetical protein
MKILVTGSRDWADTAAVKTMLEDQAAKRPREPVTLVHGAAPGADTIAAMLAEQHGWQVETFPAEWDRYGRRAGPVRNQLMVDHGADVCLVFPMPDSRGTWDCVRRARKAGIPLVYCTKYIPGISGDVLDPEELNEYQVPTSSGGDDGQHLGADRTTGGLRP